MQRSQLITLSVIYLLLAPTMLPANEAEDLSKATRQHVFFYVSTNGNDAWSGALPAPNPESTDGPFASLRRARDAIRALKSAGELESNVTVSVLGGTYYFDETLLLDGRDAGSAQCTVTYTAYPGQQPVLSGGRRIDKWQDHGGPILKADVPQAKKDAWKFRQLFYDGKRQTRARWPNTDPADPLYSGWAFIEATLPEGEKRPTMFRFSADAAPRDWAKPLQAEVDVFPWYCWVNDIISLKHFDVQARTLTLAKNPSYDFSTLMTGNRFCVENLLEELDLPGEWCLDTETGTVYFWPPEGSVKFGNVVAPWVDTLIELRGTADAPIRNVTISGLTFTETHSTFPEHLHGNFHAPLLRGAAVRLEHCDNCRITDNRFFNLGSDAVRLQGHNTQNQIVGNEIAFVGAAGISLASNDASGSPSGRWTDIEELRRCSARYPKSVRNLITNNYIHHCGVIKKNGGAVQAYGINSVDNVISHNLIHDVADKGIVAQDGFGCFIIEYNEMYNLNHEIADTGGIMINRWYSLKDDLELDRCHLIQFNLIRNCIGCGAFAATANVQGTGAGLKAGGKIYSPYYTWGIYFDNSGMDNVVYGNIIVSTVLGAVSMPVGVPKNNRVENNIFVESSGNQFDLLMSPGSYGNRFVRNIVYYKNPAAALLAASSSAVQSLSQCDYNLYWPAAGQAMRVRGIGQETFDDWKKLGFEEHSLIADPLLVDVEGGDYRLRPESPAFRLGFCPIDVERIGRQGKYRAASP